MGGCNSAQSAEDPNNKQGGVQHQDLYQPGGGNPDHVTQSVARDPNYQNMMQTQVDEQIRLQNAQAANQAQLEQKLQQESLRNQANSQAQTQLLLHIQEQQQQLKQQQQLQQNALNELHWKQRDEYMQEHERGKKDISMIPAVGNGTPSFGGDQQGSRASSPEAGGYSSEFERRLTAMVQTYAPKHLKDIPVMMRSVPPGEEEEYIRQLVQKYGPEPPAQQQVSRAGSPSTGSAAVATPAVAIENRGASSTDMTETAVAVPPLPQDYEARIRAMITKYDPQYTEHVPTMLNSVPKGQEEEYIRQLVEKYGPEPPSHTSRAGSPVTVDATTTVPQTPAPPQTPATPQDYEARVRNIIKTYDPQYIEHVPTMLSSVPKGQEEEYIKQLVEKYGPEPTTVAPTPLPVFTPAPAPAVAPNDYERRVRAMITKYDPQYIEHVPTMLTSVPKGQEEEYIKQLVEKYGPEPELGPTPVAGSSVPQTPAPPQTPAAPQDYEARVRNIIKTYDPQYIDHVPTMLSSVPKGQEEEYIKQLVEKYGPEPTAVAPTPVPTFTPAPAPAVAPKDYERRVRAMITKYDPQYIGHVPTMLTSVPAGQEEQYIQQLVEKYGPEPELGPTPVAGSSVPQTPAPPQTPAAPQDYEARVRNIIKTYDPQYIEHVPTMLSSVPKGQEEEYIKQLVEKYGPEPATVAPTPVPTFTPAPAVAPKDYERRIRAMITKYDPQYIDHVPTMLSSVPEGQEEEYIKQLVEKYGPEPNINDIRSTSSATIPPTPQPPANFEQRVRNIIAQYEPRYLSHVPAMINSVPKGAEEVYLQQLVEKYGPEPTSTPASMAPTPAPQTGPIAIPVNFERRVTAMIKHYDPQYLDQLPTMLNSVPKGQEEEYISQLVDKYGPEPEAPTMHDFGTGGVPTFADNGTYANIALAKQVDPQALVVNPNLPVYGAGPAKPQPVDSPVFVVPVPTFQTNANSGARYTERSQQFTRLKRFYQYNGVVPMKTDEELRHIVYSYSGEAEHLPLGEHNYDRMWAQLEAEYGPESRIPVDFQVVSNAQLKALGENQLAIEHATSALPPAAERTASSATDPAAGSTVLQSYADVYGAPTHSHPHTVSRSASTALASGTSAAGGRAGHINRLRAYYKFYRVPKRDPEELSEEIDKYWPGGDEGMSRMWASLETRYGPEPVYHSHNTVKTGILLPAAGATSRSQSTASVPPQLSHELLQLQEQQALVRENREHQRMKYGFGVNNDVEREVQQPPPPSEGPLFYKGTTTDDLRYSPVTAYRKQQQMLQQQRINDSVNNAATYLQLDEAVPESAGDLNDEQAAARRALDESRAVSGAQTESNAIVPPTESSTNHHQNDGNSLLPPPPQFYPPPQQPQQERVQSSANDGNTLLPPPPQFYPPASAAGSAPPAVGVTPVKSTASARQKEIYEKMYAGNRSSSTNSKQGAETGYLQNQNSAPGYGRL